MAPRRLCGMASALAIVGIALAAAPAGAASLLVTNDRDTQNGDVSSPAALRRNDGGDGISLREALLAAGAVAGPHTITFDPTLAGSTIRLRSALPHISRAGMTLRGLTTADGRPRVTIDARNAGNAQQVLLVMASSFTMTGLRLVGVGTDHAMIAVRAGETWFYGRAPDRVAHVRLEGNEFGNRGATAMNAVAIEIATQSARNGRGCRSATIANVAIANNRFVDFDGNGGWADGILLRAGGDACRITDVAIHGNRFTRVVLPVELATNPGRGNAIVRTHIVANVFRESYAAVSLNPVGDVGRNEDSLIGDTTIERNVFDLNLDVAIGLHGGVDDATNNVVARTRIANNLIIRGACPSCAVGPTGADGSGGGIYIADNDPPAAANRVTGVTIVNTTVVRRGAPGYSTVSVNAIADGVTGVTIANSIFWGNGADDFNGVSVAGVRFSRTSQPGFAGVNGNIAADPAFADPGAGDYRLAAGSPAIDAGTSGLAPARDLECRGRVDVAGIPNTGAGARPYVDLGAFEFAGTTANCAVPLAVAPVGDGAGTVTTWPRGIACGSACLRRFAFGSDVRLTATPAAGSVFAGWSGGGCAGTAPCSVRLVSPVTVRARFEPAP